jgi:hypothetical protein
VRHNTIEEIVHQTSTTDKRARSSTTTINAGCSELLYLNTPEEQAVAIARLHAYIREVAMPFLARDYTIRLGRQSAIVATGSFLRNGFRVKLE